MCVIPSMGTLIGHVYQGITRELVSQNACYMAFSFQTVELMTLIRMEFVVLLVGVDCYILWVLFHSGWINEIGETNLLCIKELKNSESYLTVKQIKAVKSQKSIRLRYRLNSRVFTTRDCVSAQVAWRWLNDQRAVSVHRGPVLGSSTRNASLTAWMARC